MATVRHFDSFTSARTNLRSVLDAARQGLVTTVTRDRERYVVVAAEALGHDLRRLLPARAAVVAEGGGWSVVLPGVPVHGDADSFAGAVDDLVVALRDYAEDWNTRLSSAPNHQQHRSLVELVELSDDDQLRGWVLGQEQTSGGAAGAAAPA